MKIKFLGTAAAEGVPSLFCDCEKCVRSRRLGGRNLRSRAQALVDDKLLIDFGPDTNFHLTTYGLSLSNIENCLITHIHGDHLLESELYYLASWGAHPHKGYVFNLYGSKDLEKTKEKYEPLSDNNLRVNMVEPFVPFKVGGYTVTALRAWHGTENPYIYLISDGKKTILYANDTDVFPEESWEYLEKTKPFIDLVAMDCTNGNSWEITYRGHMGMIQNVECKKRLEDLGIIGENTVLLLNHFSHNGTDVVYDDFVPKAEENGFLATYDGMEIEI